MEVRKFDLRTIQAGVNIHESSFDETIVLNSSIEIH